MKQSISTRFQTLQRFAHYCDKPLHPNQYPNPNPYPNPNQYPNPYPSPNPNQYPNPYLNPTTNLYPNKVLSQCSTFTSALHAASAHTAVINASNVLGLCVLHV